MKFAPIPINEAKGHILGHNVTGDNGRRLLRKGKPLSEGDIGLLHQLGHTTVYVAQIEPGDVDENSAATRIAQAIAGEHIRLSGASTGRVNLFAEAVAVVRIDATGLLAINACEGVTLATLRGHTAVSAGKMVATLKIIPYALPEKVVLQAISAVNGSVPIRLTPIKPRRVSLILSGSPASETRVRSSFQTALLNRLEPLAAALDEIDFIPLENEEGEKQLAQTISRRVAGGSDLVILAGETAIMDRFDIAPRAVERSGGQVTCFGAPVDPGNLLMLGYLSGIPIVGAPGCVRSPKKNIIDLILPRLLAGDHLLQKDIIALGHGGMLEDVPERPLPRSKLI